MPCLYMQALLHCIDINSIISLIIPLKVKSLLLLHSLSGCNPTGNVNAKGKTKSLAVSDVCDDGVISALLSVESDNPLGQIAMLKKIVCRLYWPRLSYQNTERHVTVYIAQIPHNVNGCHLHQVHSSKVFFELLIKPEYGRSVTSMKEFYPTQKSMDGP